MQSPSRDDAPVSWHRIVAVLAVGLLALEAVTQLFTWAWVGRPYGTFRKYRWSGYGLVRNNPELTMPGYDISPDGFRNRADYDQRKPPRTLRVVMLGASVLYSSLARVMVGERLGSDATMAQYLERHLREDPELAGLEVEVLNAAVNFHHIVEISSEYITQYSHWDPDVVISFGTANDFPASVRKGEVREGKYGVLGPHPWAHDFEREANGRSFYTLVEHGVLHLEAGSALVGWSKKAGTSAIDRLFQQSAAMSLAKRPAEADQTPAGEDELNLYLQTWLSYAEAMIAVANRQDQSLAFFWEYFLAHIEQEKPLSAEERRLYDTFPTPRWAIHARQCFYARDRIAEEVHKRGVTFLDPLDALRSETRTVFADYLHYTREGNEFFARFIYEQMKPVFHARARKLRAGDPEVGAQQKR